MGESDPIEPVIPRTRRWKAAALVSCVLFLGVTPVVLAFILGARADTSLSSLEVEPVPVEAPVKEVPSVLPRPASLTITYQQPSAVLSAGLSGTVTRLIVEPGDVLTDGSDLLEVNGVLVRGYVSDRAFFRDLHYGDKGWDVANLQTYLADRGHASELPATGEFGPLTQAAVRNWRAQVGLPKGDTFEFRYLWRIPQPGAVLATLATTTGGIVPGEGMPVLTTAQRPQGFEVESLLPVEAGEYRFASGGRYAEIDYDGSAWSWRNVDDITAMLGADQSTAVGGTIQLREATLAISVPAAAVYEFQGNTCVLVATPGAYRPAKFAPLSGSGSSVIGQGDLKQADTVLLNPLEIQPGATCP